MGVKTRFSDYGFGREVIEKIIASLKAHGMVKLGQKGTVIPDVVRHILELSL
jgi:NADP-dependent alcohol dehydrogenase